MLNITEWSPASNPKARPICWAECCCVGEQGGEMGSNLAPVNLANESAQAIAAGQSHTCVVVTSGKVACWGYNGNGQVGTQARCAVDWEVVLLVRKDIPLPVVLRWPEHWAIMPVMMETPLSPDCKYVGTSNQSAEQGLFYPTLKYT